MYLQGYQAIQEYFPNQEFQIWRANEPGNPPRSVNVVQQVARDALLNPCSDLASVTSSERVPSGSTVTDVGVESTLGDGGPGLPFSLVDSLGSKFLTGCVFRGSEYAPVADPDSGLVAGVISCQDNIRIECTRPYFNQATTCGGVQASKCGNLGKDCTKFY